MFLDYSGSFRDQATIKRLNSDKIISYDEKYSKVESRVVVVLKQVIATLMNYKFLLSIENLRYSIRH